MPLSYVSEETGEAQNNLDRLAVDIATDVLANLVTYYTT